MGPQVLGFFSIGERPGTGVGLKTAAWAKHEKQQEQKQEQEQE